MILKAADDGGFFCCQEMRIMFACANNAEGTGAPCGAGSAAGKADRGRAAFSQGKSGAEKCQWNVRKNVNDVFGNMSMEKDWKKYGKRLGRSGVLLKVLEELRRHVADGGGLTDDSGGSFQKGRGIR